MDVAPEEPAGHAHARDRYDAGPLEGPDQAHQEAHRDLFSRRAEVQMFDDRVRPSPSSTASDSPSGLNHGVITRRSSGHRSRPRRPFASRASTASLTVAGVRSNSLASWPTV